MAKDKRKIVTIKDVAKHVGVSTATVSYVLNNKGAVSDQVKEQILAAVRSLGYRANAAAKATRTGKTRLIGLVLPDLLNPFFPELAQSVENAARQNGFAVILVDTQNDLSAEQEAADLLLTHGVDGVVWCPVSSEDSFAGLKSRLPIVLIDRPLDGYDCVLSDYVAGGRCLADRVARSGHTKIGILRGPQDIPNANLRRDAFVSALPPSVEIIWELENDFSIQIAEDRLSVLFERNVSLIIAGNDAIAIGATLALSDKGLRVPDDVSVIGHDDIQWSSILSPALTTLRQPLNDIGTAAIEVLLERIANGTKETKRVHKKMTLIERQSLKDHQP